MNGKNKEVNRSLTWTIRHITWGKTPLNYTVYSF